MSFVTGVVCVLGLGCESSPPPTPIPDPGSPFHTSVPPNTTLDALTGDQWQELCGEVSAAEKAYLVPGILAESTCRQISLEDGTVGLSVPGTGDGGADGGSFLSVCQAAYENCEKENSMAEPPSCGLDVSGCRATVELLSACLNEIANTNPVAACVTIPTCAEAAAAGTTRYDAGIVPLGTCPKSGGGPSLPACARLQPQCPGVLLSNDPYGD